MGDQTRAKLQNQFRLMVKLPHLLLVSKLSSRTSPTTLPSIRMKRATTRKFSLLLVSILNSSRLTLTCWKICGHRLSSISVFQCHLKTQFSARSTTNSISNTSYQILSLGSSSKKEKALLTRNVKIKSYFAAT